LWEEDDRPCSEVGLRVHEILTHNNNLSRYLYEHAHEIVLFKVNMVYRMLRCIRGELGGITYRCVECGEGSFLPFCCHSRVCVRCGKSYAEEWGRSFMDCVLPVRHRHVIFTLPGPLWDMVRSNYDVLLNDLFSASTVVIRRIFRRAFGDHVVAPGMISVVHFTGRDMKDNPHIHMIVTEGGLSSNGVWKKLEFFPYKLMSMYWKSEVLKRFRFHLRSDLAAKSFIDTQWKMRFRNGTNGYVVKNYTDVMGTKEDAKRKAQKIGSYLARYIRHPPIGESRILGYDGVSVTIKYEWDNQIHQTTIPVGQFIHAIFSNIPPKGFNVTRRYGLYSGPKIRWATKALVGVTQIVEPIEHYDSDGGRKKLPNIRCPRCKGVMEPLWMEYVKGGMGVVVVL